MTPNQTPAELVAGDTWEWLREYAEYSAATHTAVAYLENEAAAYSVTSAASATAFRFTATAAATVGYRPGRYRVRIVVTRTADSARFSVEAGWLELLPDPAAAGTKDWRSHARRTLDAIEATIEGRASTDQSAMTINGRSLSRTPIPELLQLRKEYRADVQREETAERIAAGQPARRRILTRLS